MGEKIFQDGVPEEKVPACAACHGPAATGFVQIPRLAGQLYPYMVKTLTNFRKDRKEHLSDVMYPVVESLNKQQIEAVAAYLSSLR